MTLPSPVARYLDGTAFIVYGPGLGPEPSTPPAHHSHTQFHIHSHSHAHHEPEDQPAHFWAVFRPSTTTTILSNPLPASFTKQQRSPTQDQDQNDNDTLFFLKGTPHPWGSYPPDMEQPHGCLPPHLYYHVTISSRTSSANTRHEWVIPYVHRMGDGNDHAGGLTTAYTLLRDQDDAEDHGDFIHTKIRQLQQFHHHRELLSSAAEATTTFSTHENSISASLYACTEILISERRTLDVIQEQFFSATAKSSSGLKEFQHHLLKLLETADRTSQSPPLSLVQSDLKLILPLQSTPSLDNHLSE